MCNEEMVSTMKREIEMMLKRAYGFIEDAVFDFEKGRFDLAMFHLEQAAQLFIKAKLLELMGYYRRSHLLRELLSDLSKVWKGTEISEFTKKYRRELRDMERAYVSARYVYEEFFREEVERALKAVKELEVLLWRG